MAHTIKELIQEDENEKELLGLPRNEALAPFPPGVRGRERREERPMNHLTPFALPRNVVLLRTFKIFSSIFLEPANATISCIFFN